MLGPIIGAFNPELVLVSAGFDAVEGDPLVRFLHQQHRIFSTLVCGNTATHLHKAILTSLSSDNGMIRLAFPEWLGSGYRAAVGCRQSVTPT